MPSASATTKPLASGSVPSRKPKTPIAPPPTWAQVARKFKSKSVDVKPLPVRQTPKGTLPNPRRYALNTDEQVAFKRGYLPSRLLPGFISRAVGAYRHFSGQNRPGPLPKATFAMIKQSAIRNLNAVCCSFMLAEQRRVSTLKAQAASKLARVAQPPGGNKGKGPSVVPPPIVVEKVIEKIVNVEVTPDSVKAELASLRAVVAELKKTVEALSGTYYPINYFKETVYGGHTVAELTKAPKDHVAMTFEDATTRVDQVFKPKFFDFTISAKDGSRPPLTFLRVSRKTAIVVSSAPVPTAFLPYAQRIVAKHFGVSVLQLANIGALY